MKRFTPELAETIKAETLKYPDHLVNVTHLNWYGEEGKRKGLKEVWASRNFRLYVFLHQDGTERLNIHRMRIDLENDTWADGITWDELQDLKRQCGRGSRLAVEVFPKDEDIINIGNVRHLWIVDETKIPFVWARKTKGMSIFFDDIKISPTDITKFKGWN